MWASEPDKGARFNPAMRDPTVLEVALARLGCCPAEDARDLAQQLLTHGRVVTPTGHVVRMVAFGDVSESYPPGAWTTVPMQHVVRSLRRYLKEHWTVLRHAQAPHQRRTNGAVRVRRRS